MRRQIDDRFWIDPDEIADQLRQRQGVPRMSDDVSRAAFKMSRSRRVDYALQRVDFQFETVFSHGSNLAFLRALKAIGYDVHLYFVCTEQKDINVARVTARVHLGQHEVDHEKIRARYDRSLALLSLAVREVDYVRLIDNTPSLDSERRGIGGRTVGEIRGDDGGAKSERINLFPAVPGWALRFAVFPFATTWMVTDYFLSAKKLFGETTHFEAPGDGAVDDRLLRQFRF